MKTRLVFFYLGEKLRKTLAKESFVAGIFLHPELAEAWPWVFQNELERLGYNYSLLEKLAS